MAENSQLFLEDITIDLMSLGPDIPFSDVVFRCGQLKWYKPEVQEAIKNLLYFNFPKIRFKGTDHEPFLAPAEKYENLRKKYEIIDKIKQKNGKAMYISELIKSNPKGNKVRIIG
jgi:hypothetical protein